MYKRGEGDARGDFDSDYRAWYGGLWSSVATALHLPDSAARRQVTGPRFSVTFVNKRDTNPIIRSHSVVGMTVRANRELQHRDCERPSERSTRHLEIALPSGVTYNAGDHLRSLRSLFSSSAFSFRHSFRSSRVTNNPASAVCVNGSTVEPFSVAL